MDNFPPKRELILSIAHLEEGGEEVVVGEGEEDGGEHRAQPSV